MTLPPKLNPQEGEKNYQVKATLDAIIEYLAKRDGVAEPIVKPADWSNGHKEHREYKPIADGSKFWVGPDGFSISRDEVPTDVLAKWEYTLTEPVIESAE